MKMKRKMRLLTNKRRRLHIFFVGLELNTALYKKKVRVALEELTDFTDTAKKMFM